MRKESNGPGRCELGIRLMFILAAVFSAASISNAQSIMANESIRPERVVNSRRVFVRSTSLLVRAAVVEDKLLKNSEFKRGFVITRDKGDADLVLELRHDLLTMYVFTVTETKTQTVIAGGKLSSLGGTVAGKVAKRFVKEMNAL